MFSNRILEKKIQNIISTIESQISAVFHALFAKRGSLEKVFQCYVHWLLLFGKLFIFMPFRSYANWDVIGMSISQRCVKLYHKYNLNKNAHFLMRFLWFYSERDDKTLADLCSIPRRCQSREIKNNLRNGGY